MVSRILHFQINNQRFKSSFAYVTAFWYSQQSTLQEGRKQVILTYGAQFLLICFPKVIERITLKHASLIIDAKPLLLLL